MVNPINFPLEPVLQVVEAQVDLSHEDEFNKWYDTRHLPDAVNCPGFRAGARYRSSEEDGPRYLTVYALDDEKAVDTPECRAISGFGHLTPYVRYTRRMYRPISSYRRGDGRHVRRNPKEELRIDGVGFPPGPVFMTVTSQVDRNHEDEFNIWYDTQHLPDAVNCPGFLAGARYRSSDQDEPQYLAAYILEDEGAVNTPECRAISGFWHLTPYVRYTRTRYRPLSSHRHGQVR